ncbi:two-component system response regulator [Streptomyces sp. NPDC090994]|uniref:response regulator n=1 Tax=Streptomyces sp. NPDC090994 TaxID=3365969 RepID=UPI003825127F
MPSDAGTPPGAGAPSDAGILIVDDHEDTLYALEAALAPLGYPLRRATSGDQALKQVLRGQVALLLLDVRIPGVDGLDVVRCMRRVEQTQHIPVVLLTGFGFDPELSATAFRLGVADLVRKPVDPWALRTKVRHLHETHRRHLALQREVRDLRARLREHTGNGPTPPGRPHPDAPAPRSRPRGAREGERDSLQKDRT